MRRFRKKKIAALIFVFSFLSCIFICFINANIGLSGIVLLISLAAIFFILRKVESMLNKLVKHTNWYKNQYIFTHQFVSNAGYRINRQRNYEIVNVGSNPARFCFFYENVKGQNWSTGTQGLDKDLEILKYFHSYVKEGGYILLPIVAFSSVSGYLPVEKESDAYRAKFVAILDWIQVKKWKNATRVRKYFHKPFTYNWRTLRYLLHDVQKDNRIELDNQHMQHIELLEDAAKWMNCWKNEFNIKDFKSPLSGKLLEGRNKTIEMFKALLDFCIERGYKPVIVSPPFSKELSELFTPDIKEIYVDSFIREFKDYNVKYLDYIYDEKFSDSSLYFNALFMNMAGRKAFTKQVLKDLGIN